jgi:hypothetical protein
MRTQAKSVLPTALLLLLAGPSAVPASGQTVRGTLLARDTDQPIALARVTLLTEAGDTVAAGVTGPSGGFALSAPGEGSYHLSAEALGYRTTTAGVFDLGAGGEISVEFRIQAEAVALEGITVDVTGLVRDPFLISSGFYQRMQSGQGRFITPEEIEKSDARRVTELFYGIPRVFVVMQGSRDRIMMNSPMGVCAPNVYVDGMLTSSASANLEMFAPLLTVEAIEVYRSPAELPLQWSGTAARGCGAIVVWTKRR